MKFPVSNSSSGMTLTELLVALGIGGLVTTVVLTLFLFGLRSFAGLGNYAMLSGQSRLALDRISQEVRAATKVLVADTNLPVRSLILTNSVDATSTTFTWDSSSGVLTCDKTGQPTRTNLTGCDEWDFSLYQRSPNNNWTFYPTSDPALCKQLSMSWTCSRTILGQKLNTDDSVSAQFVLRNKP
jgi:prepilin-type N-terminal cleavage/methylation domain-containing protein